MAENNVREESQDQTSSADAAISFFLKEIAVAVVVVGGIPAFLSGKVSVSAYCVGVAVVFLIAGSYWPKLKSIIKPRFANYLDKLANNSRCRRWATVLFILVPVCVVAVYVVNIRHDLDTYVMPRVVTPNQEDRVQKHLLARNQQSGINPQAVIIRVNKRDREADKYSHQIVKTLRGSHWAVTLDRVAEPPTLDAGLCLHEVGIKPKNDPKTILQEALGKANIYSPNCSDPASDGPATDGEYKLVMLVGHRPFELRTGRIRRMGQMLIKYGR